MPTGFLSFVGREEELSQLRRALDQARAGQGGVWLLSGDAGLGKSRLMEEGAHLARELGFSVAWGRCWEAGGAPAFWPWTQALRALCRGRALSGAAASVRERLSLLLPELAERPSEALAEPSERFLLLEALTSALCDLASVEPVLVLLDDLHAADHSSLALLDFAARQLHSSGVLVVGAYRGVEAQSSEHGALLHRIAQNAHAIPLSPLSPDQVARYLQAAAPSGRSALAAALHARTEGNPLFMVELVRTMTSRSGTSPQALEAMQLPSGLEAVLAACVERLSEPGRQVIECASILGRELSSEDAVNHFSCPAQDVRDALEEGVRLGVLQPMGGSSYRFRHILLRDVVERGIGEARRRALHLRLARSLQAATLAGDGSHARVAHHFEAAGEDGRPQAIAAYARAGEAAAGIYAFEAAAAAYRKALALLDRGEDEPRTRAELQIGLCRVLTCGGERERGRTACRGAAALARQLGDAELLARAGLEFGSVLVFAHVDSELVELLREALCGLPPGDSALRALVQARLAAALQPAPDPQEPVRLARQAIGMARRVGDPATLLSALRTGCSAMVDLAAPELRLSLDREHAALAAAAGELQDALRANTRLIFDCFELGDRLGADAAARAAADLVRRIDHPTVRWRLHAMDAMRALWDGALEEALRCCNQAAGIGEACGDRNARSATSHQRVRILRALGRVDELLEAAAQARNLYAGTPTMERYQQVAMAGVMLEVRGAQSALRGLGVGTLLEVVQLGDRTMYEPVAELALAAGERTLSSEIHSRLCATPDQFLVGGVLGMTWESPVRRVLSLCAQNLGRPQEAIEHLRRGIELARSLGGDPVATRMTVELGELLAGAGRSSEAQTLLRRAHQEANSLGMGLLQERSAAALAPREQPGTAPGAPASPSPVTDSSPGAAQLRLELEGDVWRVAFGTAAVRVKDGKGMRYLAALAAQPRTAVHVLDLVAPALRHAGQSDGGELLDAKARGAYRERARELRSELDRAQQWNDSARADALSAELQQLNQELARGLGLGGRSRKFSSNAERARINVQRRIRDAIGRIRAGDASLGRHLERSVRTGMLCSYDPE